MRLENVQHVYCQPPPAGLRRDMRGERCGKRVVTGFAYRNGLASSWWCLCECGRRWIVAQSSLYGGKTKSCGCTSAAKTHGQSHSRLYHRWVTLRQKAVKENVPVADAWSDFQVFHRDVGDRPTEQHVLARKVLADGYCPGNLSWILHPGRPGVIVEVDGESANLRQWARRIGVSRQCMHQVYHSRSLPMVKRYIREHLKGQVDGKR